MCLSATSTPSTRSALAQFVGGWLFKTFGKMTRVHPVPGITGLNLESVFVAVVGAVVLLIAYHAISRADGPFPARTSMIYRTNP